MELNADVVQSLLTCDWLKNCGKPPEEITGVRCLFLSSKAQLEKNYKTIKWENICLEACNDVTSYLFLNHMNVYHKVWNNLVGRVKEELLPKVVDTISERIALWELPGITLDYVKFDIVNMAVIASYADYCKSPFYEKMLLIYRAGRLPCGWGGKYPKGTFQVY